MGTWVQAAAVVGAVHAMTMAQPAHAGPADADRSATQLAQRRATPDTSTPGSTAPGFAIQRRPAYVSQEDRRFAAELRGCESLGDATKRLACKEAVRERYGEM